MTALNKWLKMNTKVTRAKGSSSKNPEPREQEDEATWKEKEEATRRLAAGAKKLLAKEKQQEKEEEEVARKKSEKDKRKKEEAIKWNIVELERAINQEDLNSEQEVQDQEGFMEEKTKES